MVARVGVSLPFACRDDDGGGDASVVLKRRAIQCALSRVCAVCGEPLTRPIAFAGTADEVASGAILFPPAHRACLEPMLADRAPLGHAAAPATWTVVTTGGFDLVRPTRRGLPVVFRPNSVLETHLVTDGSREDPAAG